MNVLPGDVPQDAYRVIAEASKDKIPASVRTVWDRKCTKRTVMTVPYNAKPFSNRGYIREALKEKGVQIENEDLTKIVSAVRQAMDDVVPGPMKVMKWIEAEVAEAIKRGATEITWTTPSGFTVTQRLMKKVVEHIDLQLLGRVQLKVATDDSDEVDIKHHKNATAPNLIHSLDASLYTYQPSVSEHRWPSYMTRYLHVLSIWISYRLLLGKHTCTYLPNMII